MPAWAAHAADANRLSELVDLDFVRDAVHAVEACDVVVGRVALELLADVTLQRDPAIVDFDVNQFDADATSLGDLVADKRAVDPSGSAIARENCRELWAMLRLLPERHRQVLIRRYGLNDSRTQTHKQIGQSIGVGEKRARQIEREALQRLRSIAANSRRAA